MKSKSFLLVLAMMIFSASIQSQVAINSDGSSADPSAILDVKSTEMGLLPPRMSTMEKYRISNPAEGLIIYNTTTHAMEIFNGSTWMAITEEGLVMEPLNYQVAIGGEADETAYSVVQASDDGYYIGGITSSFGAGGNDFYCLKLTPEFTLDIDFGTNGTVVCGGSGTEVARSVVLTDDGGCMLGGYSYSFGAGVVDFYTLKLTSEGEPDETYGNNGILTIGQSAHDRGYCLQPVSDGNFIMAGYSVLPSTTNYECYVVKFTAAGAMDNNFGTNGTFRIGGSGFESLIHIIETDDNGFLSAGNTTTYDAGGYDFYVFKLTSAGILDNNFGTSGILAIGGSGDEGVRTILQAPDNGYLVVGYTQSFGAGGNDYYLVKLTSTGALDNSFGTNGTLTIGGSGNDLATCALITEDDHYLIGGYSESYGAGGDDFYVIKLSMAGIPDSTFGVNGTLTIGGTGDEVMNSICLLNDGGYLMAGSTTSFGSGGLDVYLVRINIAGGTCDFMGYGGGITGSGGALNSGGELSSGGTLGSGGTLSSGGILTLVCQ